MFVKRYSEYEWITSCEWFWAGGNYVGSGGPPTTSGGSSGSGAGGNTVGAVVGVYNPGFADEDISDLLILIFTNNLVYYGDGAKPIKEFDNKCEGVNEMWELSKNSNNEFAAVLTSDGSFLIIQELESDGGGIAGIYEYGNTTYYQYSMSEGAPARTYPGQLIRAGRYFIPIKATIHSHTPCINDGTDGITANTISKDQTVAKKYEQINHYILGCSAIGQFNGNSNKAFNIKSGSLSSLCNQIN